MKIPFERTIASAYRFAFTNILSVIGTGWFPFLLVSALGAGLAVLFYPSIHGLWLEDRKTFDSATVMTHIVPMVGAVVVVMLALVVAQAMVTVGLMRKALGLHPGPVFVFFSLGGQVWRLIGSYILMYLLMWGGILVTALGISAVGMVLNQLSLKMAPVVLSILVFVAVLAFIYSIVRLSFFIPAVVVAENHIGLRRSWHLGRGNFWRIVGITLVVSLPIQLAFSTISSTMLQIAMVPGLGYPSGPLTDAQGQKLVSDLLEAFGRVGPYYAVLLVVYFALLSGLTTGAVAAAYQALAGDTKAVA